MFSPASAERAAEREGMAADRLAELLGTEPAETRRQRVLGQWRAALALGLPERPKMKPYRKVASMRAHAYLTERAPWRVAVWGRPASKRLPADVAAERFRQAQKRLARARKLTDLRYLPARQTLTVPLASVISGIGERTLQRACEQGRLGRRDMTPTSSNGLGRTGRWIVTAGELRQILENKLAGKPIAA
jgi:hypothetical protein